MTKKEKILYIVVITIFAAFFSLCTFFDMIDYDPLMTKEKAIKDSAIMTAITAVFAIICTFSVGNDD